MYRSKPINSVCVIEHYPTVMYRVKSIYDDVQMPATTTAAVAANDSSLDLINLNKDSQSQHRRLTRLHDKINQFCDDLSLSHLIIKSDSKSKPLTTSTPATSSDQAELFPGRVTLKTSKKACVEDYVVHVSYKSVPYALLATFSQMATKFKCFIQFYTHGTAVNELKKCENLRKKLDAVRELFHSLKLDLVDNRNSYDFGISIVWKKVSDESLGPVLSINSKSSIYGESNIVRYLNRLLESRPALERDLDVMDKCSNELLFSQQKQRQDLYLTGLNKSVGSGKFVSFGERAGMADFYVWSVLKQTSSFDAKKFAAISQWMNLVEGSSPMLQMLNQLVVKN